MRKLALCHAVMAAAWLVCVVARLAPAQEGLSPTNPRLSQVAKLVPHGDGVPGGRNYFFGESAALDADTAVVGAPAADTAGLATGAAIVFVRSGTTWSEQAKLLPRDPGVLERFGESVAISGDTAVVGAPWDDTDAGEDAGSAYVFVRSGTTWSQQAKLAAADGAAHDCFGSSVSISGGTVVVGAPFDDTTPESTDGSAYVFVRSGTTWSQQAKLVAADGAAGDAFGTAVAISSDTAVVGAPYVDTAAGDAVGAVYVFVRSGTAWGQRQKLISSSATPGAYFGTSAAIEGETIVGGAIFDDAPPVARAGSAVVFVRSGTAWSEQQKLVAGDPGQDDRFGVSVSVAGDSVVVGASLAGTPSQDMTGAAYVFVRSGEVWSEPQKLVLGDGASLDEFGRGVAVSGATALVGAPGHDPGTVKNAGAAYAFVRSGATWSEQGELTPSDDAAYDSSGSALSLSGDSLAVGAPGDVTVARPPGSVTVFVRSAAGWAEQQKLTPADGGSSGGFGISVALSGDTLVVGAPYAVAAGARAGAAYVFVRSGTLWSLEQRLTASDAAAGDGLGAAVAVSGDTLVVGAPFGDDPAVADAGAAYVFVRAGTLWNEQQKLTAGGGTLGDLFGLSVSIAGDTVVVGAPRADSVAGERTGGAYVFARWGAVWHEQQWLAASDGTLDDQFGRSVSLSGETLAVGSFYGDTPTAYNAGSVYVFARSGTVWSEQQKLWALDGAPGDLFGVAVALDGDTLAAGAGHRATPAGAFAGAAYVFTRSGAAWSQQSRLVARDGAAHDYLGDALSLSERWLAVGAPHDSTAAGFASGSAYVFEPKLKGDFDRDLRTDLLFRNEPGAYHEAWLMDGVVRLDTLRAVPDLTDSAWQVAGVDDFNADGQDDLVLWNSLTGAVEFWFMNGATRAGDAVPLGGAPTLATTWRLSATGDFNADGNPDLVWRNDLSQKVVIWTMRDTVKAGNIIPSPGQSVDPNWEIVAALDYNGDGARDFLWYNRDSGKVVLWFMDASVVRLGGQFTNPPNAGDHNWKVLAGGDYGTGAWGLPGTNDLVWRNSESGRIVVWYMDLAANRTAGTFTTPDAPGPDPLDWTLAGPR